MFVLKDNIKRKEAGDVPFFKKKECSRLTDQRILTHIVRGSIIVQLTSFLAGLDSAALLQ